MNTALKRWVLHFEYPHSRHEWAMEATSMLHDRFFWGTVLVLLFTVLFIGLIAFGAMTSPATGSTMTVRPISWPYLHMGY